MASATWKAFSAADHLACNADSSWEAIKDRGNAALKNKDYVGAAKLYHKAALLAMGPLEGGAVHAFITSLEEWPEGSPQRRLVENEDLLWSSIIALLPMPLTDRHMQLPDGHGEMVAKYPNKGAAIAWANRAQALLLAGLPKVALRCAQRATEANPEYLKAHHRELKALEALGEVTAAAKKEEEMRDYQTARSLYPAEALALLHAGWIDWERATLVYGPVRFAAAAEAVVEYMRYEAVEFGAGTMILRQRSAEEAKKVEGPFKVEARASIVPFQGGQLLMLSVLYGNDQRVDCIDFAMADVEHGAMADQPPHGHASPLALKHSPLLIGKFLTELAQWDLYAVALMCGQGLVEHVDMIDKALKAGVPGVLDPIDDVLVYASSSTHASEASGVGAPLLGDRAAMEAMMRRLLSD